MAEDITYLVNIISVFLPLAILLAYFFVNNKLAHSIAGLIASSFIFGFGTYILQNEALNVLGSELFTIFAFGAVFSLLFSQGSPLRSIGGMFGGRGTAPGPTGALPPATPHPAPNLPPPAASGNLIFMGRMIEQTTNRPITGVEVRIEGYAPAPITDVQGRFQIDIRPRRQWNLMLQTNFRFSFNHPDYFVRNDNIPTVGPVTDIGSIQLQPRTPPGTVLANPFLYNTAGTPTTNVFRGQTYQVRFIATPGFQFRGNRPANDDRFHLTEQGTGRLIVVYQQRTRPADWNYTSPTEVRVSITIPATFVGGSHLPPFSDVTVDMDNPPPHIAMVRI